MEIFDAITVVARIQAVWDRLTRPLRGRRTPEPQRAANGTHTCSFCGEQARDDQQPRTADGSPAGPPAQMIKCTEPGCAHHGGWLHGLHCYSLHSPSADARTAATASTEPGDF